MVEQFNNREFQAEVRHMRHQIIRIHVRSRLPPDRDSCDRQLAAFIYEVAAELESRSDDIPGARWAISPAASEARVDVELGKNDDSEAARRLVNTVIAELGLL